MANEVTKTSTRLSRIEGLLGVTDDLDVAPGYTVLGGLATLTGQVQEMNRMLASLLEKEKSTPSPRREGDVENSPLVRNLMGELEALKDKINGGSGMSHARLKVPDPKSFDGLRDAKALENFIWDLEHYFIAAHVGDKDKVIMATMFLSGDAKIWWRSRAVDDKESGRIGISNWEEMKEEMRNQFLPHHVSWVARDKLKDLKQTGSV